MQIAEILEFLEESSRSYVFSGNETTEIAHFCALSQLRERSVTWIKQFQNITPDVREKLNNCQNLLIITGDQEVVEEKHSYIVVQNPKAVFFQILSRFFEKKRAGDVAEDSVVETVHIGRNFSIGHHCYINSEVEIGDDVSIAHNVSIVSPCKIGDRVIIHSGTVIGTDGFGYYEEDGVNRKVPHFGGVLIGNDVEVGANTCIDRGTIGDTIIADNAKIDNLCHIAHNAYVGENSLLTAGAIVGGSSRLEKDTYVGVGALIRNQMVVGKHAFIAMGAVVTKSVESEKLVAGVPAKVLRDNT